jgi:hypothetical protein
MSHASREQKKTKARKEKIRQAEHQRRLRRTRNQKADRSPGIGSGGAGAVKTRLPKRSFEFAYAFYTTADGFEIDTMPQVWRRVAMPLVLAGLYTVVSATGYGLSQHLLVQIVIFASLVSACIWPLRSRQRLFISTEKDILATRPTLLSKQTATETRLSAIESFDSIATSKTVTWITARLKDGSELRLLETNGADTQGTHKLLRYLRDPALILRERP